MTDQTEYAPFRSPAYVAMRLAFIRDRRAANARARAKGFRNYAEMSAYVD